MTALLEKIADGRHRLTAGEAAVLFCETDLHGLTAAANAVNRRKNGEVATFIIDTNFNYTNICIADCPFCAFYRHKEALDSYTLTTAQIDAKIEEAMAYGATQVLLQGGHHPNLKLDWYLELISHIRKKYPINLHAFSPPELFHIAKINKIPLRDMLVQMKEAGLGSIPGGGAEILNDRVRNKIADGKCTADEWIGVCRTAHELGLKSSATMMFGHVETLDERIEHLERLRRLQDETHGFIHFVPWTFKPGNTELGGHEIGAHEYLKMVALARLYLDNFDHIGASWLTQGSKVAQIALTCGADDLGNTLFEENVINSTGQAHRTTVAEMKRITAELGLALKQRDSFFGYVS